MKQKQDFDEDKFIIGVFTLGMLVGGWLVIGLVVLSRYLFDY